MHPTLFTVQFWGHDWTVMSYSFFYCVAIFFVLIGSYVVSVRHGFSRRVSIIMLTTMAVSGFIGARVLHYIFNPSIYLSAEKSILDLHMTGFTIVGGLLAAIIGGYGAGKILKIDVWSFADWVIPCVAGGIVIARVGCYLNGCCFGYITDVVWGVTFPLLSEAHKYQLTHGVGSIFFVSRVHPAQIYEMIGALSGGIVALFIIYKKMFTGAAVLVFGMWFSVCRALNLFFRQMPDSLHVSRAQYAVIYLCIFLFCLVIFCYRWYKNRTV